MCSFLKRICAVPINNNPWHILMWWVKAISEFGIKVHELVAQISVHTCSYVGQRIVWRIHLQALWQILYDVYARLHAENYWKVVVLK